MYKVAMAAFSLETSVFLRETTLTFQTLNASCIKRGRRKLGRTYAQPFQKRRVGRVSVELLLLLFFFSAKRFFALLSSTFMRVVFTTVNFEDK